MPKHALLILVLVLLITTLLPAQTLQLPLATARLSSGNALIELPDTSLVISSFYQSGSGPFGFGGLNVTRVAVDTGVVWSKDIAFEQGGNRSTVRHWASQDALLLGATLTNGFPYKVVSRLDLDGNLIWSRRFGSLTDFNNINLGLIDLVPEDNGTFIVAGGSQRIANSNDANDLYVARVDAGGNVVWANNYCFSCLGRDVIFSDILATQDGGYLISGGVSGTGINIGSANLLLMKISANGDLEWCNQYQSTMVFSAFTQVGREAVQLPNGNYVVAGFYDDFPSSVRDGLLMEVSPAGDFLRAVHVNIVGSSHEVTFNNLIALDDNTLVVPGSSDEDVLISESRVFNFLLQIQLDGTLDWAYNYFEEELLGFSTPRNDLIRFRDNRYGYLVNDHEGFDSLNPVLLITDENGQTGCEEPIDLTTDPSVIYTASSLFPDVLPNPEVADYGTTINDYEDFTLDQPMLDLGPDTAFCQDFTLALDASVGVPATYSWSTGQTSPSINVNAIGEYIVTVTATDLCFQLTDTVLIDQLEGPMQSLDTTLCDGQSLTIAGTTYDVAGEYTAFLPGPICDTMLNLSLTILPAAVSTLDTLLCPGSVLTIGTETYTESGTYVQTFPTADACDSTVNIIFGFFEPPAAIIETGVVNCTDQTVVLNATAGSGWLWSTGATSNTIAAPAPGSYTLNFTDSNGCQREETLDLQPIEEEPLDVSLIAQSDFGGFGVSCSDASDGELTVDASVGQSPYTFEWSTGATLASITGLSAGVYQVTASDNSGCLGTATLEVTAPESLLFDLDAGIVGCAGFEEGTIAILDPSGGVEPYLYALNEEAAQLTPLFVGLSPGNYTVNLIDANGCTVQQTTNLPELTVPFLDLGQDETIRLGEAVQIRAQTNLTNISQFDWTPELGLSCINCLEPEASPQTTTVYELTLTDSLGCTVTSDLRITVTSDRSIFVPNVFSPNGDGANDSFFPFASPEVERFGLFQIYDRWGGLVFETQGLGLADPSAGWDGEIAGQSAPIGVYVYMLEVVYVDGQETIMSGDLTLVR